MGQKRSSRTNPAFRNRRRQCVVCLCLWNSPQALQCRYLVRCPPWEAVVHREGPCGRQGRRVSEWCVVLCWSESFLCFRMVECVFIVTIIGCCYVQWVWCVCCNCSSCNALVTRTTKPQILERTEGCFWLDPTPQPHPIAQVAWNRHMSPGPADVGGYLRGRYERECVYVWIDLMLCMVCVCVCVSVCVIVTCGVCVELSRWQITHLLGVCACVTSFVRV